jgi:hypothetical protein
MTFAALPGFHSLFRYCTPLSCNPFLKLDTRGAKTRLKVRIVDCESKVTVKTKDQA